MRVIAIAVVGANGVIGDGHSQPFAFREDWERFKATTLGHPIILGRHTLEAMGRYLPGRTTIVVSRDPEQIELSDADNAPSFAVGSVETALELAEALDGGELTFVGGGGQVYRHAWDFLTELDITQVHAEAVGSVTFPDIDPDEWRCLSREPRAEFDFTRWFPITRTDRLELSPVHPDDLDDWLRLHTDPALYQHAPEAMVVDRQAQADALAMNSACWLDHGQGYWLARDRVDQRLLGVGGARYRADGEVPFWNLYYRFAVEAQGRGLAQELARATAAQLAVLDPAAELRAYVRPANAASTAVAQNLGLQHTDTRTDEHGQPQQVWSAPVGQLQVL